MIPCLSKKIHYYIGMIGFSEKMGIFFLKFSELVITHAKTVAIEEFVVMAPSKIVLKCMKSDT